MNFLELINLTLQELNYKRVSSFGDLIKPDHKKIMTIVSRVNDVLLDSCDWDFMLRDYVLEVPANVDRVEVPVDMKIKTVFLDDERLLFTDMCELFLSGRGISGYYAVFNRKLYVVPKNKRRKLKIVYVTKNHAISAAGFEVPTLVNGDDVTLIPDEFARTALVYGACIQFKSNPQHPKYKHWLNGFVDARSQMRASLEHVVSQPPKIRLPRWTLGYDKYHNL